MRSWPILLALLFAPGPALAGTSMVVAWATWLHASPGPRTPVLNELPSGFVVEVLGCEAGWCRVVSDRAEGYVEQAVLAATRTGPVVRGEGDCFPAAHVTPERSIAMQICPARTP